MFFSSRLASPAVSTKKEKSPFGGSYFFVYKLSPVCSCLHRRLAVSSWQHERSDGYGKIYSDAGNYYNVGGGSWKNGTPYGDAYLVEAIDGVYSADPKVDANAVRYDEISIQEVIDKKLQVVDLTASILAMENKMPMYVFALQEENSIVKAVSGKFNGTIVTV